MAQQCDQPNVSDQVAQMLAAKRTAMVAKLHDMGSRRQQVLFDGQWLTPQQAKKRYRIAWRKNWVICIELLVLFAAMVLSAAFLGIFLVFMVGLKP